MINEVSSSQSVVEEWERDIRQSVSLMLDRSMSDFRTVFEVLHLHFPSLLYLAQCVFLPSKHRQVYLYFHIIAHP